MKNVYDTEMMWDTHLAEAYSSNMSLSRFHQMRKRFSRRLNGKV